MSDEELKAIARSFFNQFGIAKGKNTRDKTLQIKAENIRDINIDIPLNCTELSIHFHFVQQKAEKEHE